MPRYRQRNKSAKSKMGQPTALERKEQERKSALEREQQARLEATRLEQERWADLSPEEQDGKLEEQRAEDVQQ